MDVGILPNHVKSCVSWLCGDCLLVVDFLRFCFRCRVFNSMFSIVWSVIDNQHIHLIVLVFIFLVPLNTLLCFEFFLKNHMRYNHMRYRSFRPRRREKYHYLLFRYHTDVDSKRRWYYMGPSCRVKQLLYWSFYQLAIAVKASKIDGNTDWWGLNVWVNRYFRMAQRLIHCFT